MDWKQIVGVMLFGSIPSFLPLWLEGMWPVGSWQWGALTLACLIMAIALINWDRWSISFPKIRFVWSNNESQKQSTSALLVWFDEWMQGPVFAITVLFGLVLLLGYCESEISKRVFGRQWGHSYMSADETQKAEDACVMKAYEAIGGGKYQRQHDRQDYIDACMENQGFVQQDGGL